MNNETLISENYININFNIDDKKIISVSPDGTTFTVYNGILVLYTCKLKPRLTANYRNKFVLENPFEEDIIFDCSDNTFDNVLSWIVNRETNMESKNEIS